MKIVLLVLFFTLPLFAASQTDSSTEQSPSPLKSTTDHSATVTPPSTTSKPPSNNSHKLVPGNSKPHHATTKKPGNQITGRPGATQSTPVHFPPPTHSTHFHQPPPAATHHQSVAALVFEILGVVAACIFVLSVIRCLYIYKRTPARDRIAAILHRHQLQREMEELERNPPALFRRSMEPPPPPYLRPPGYDDRPAPPQPPPSRSQARQSLLRYSPGPPPDPPHPPNSPATPEYFRSHHSPSQSLLSRTSSHSSHSSHSSPPASPELFPGLELSRSPNLPNG